MNISSDFSNILSPFPSSHLVMIYFHEMGTRIRPLLDMRDKLTLCEWVAAKNVNSKTHKSLIVYPADYSICLLNPIHLTWKREDSEVIDVKVNWKILIYDDGGDKIQFL